MNLNCNDLTRIAPLSCFKNYKLEINLNRSADRYIFLSAIGKILKLFQTLMLTLLCFLIN